MTSNNLNEVQNSNNCNDFKNGSSNTPKSCLKQISKLNIPTQFDLLKKLDQNDDDQTEVCSEKNLDKNNQYINVSKFKDYNEADEDEISINLDDLDDFECTFKEQRPNEKQDISMFDNLRKKIDFKSTFKITDIVKLYENI